MSSGSDLLMPKLGLTMTEGTVASWACRPGERFREGDVLLVVETDKIANDVLASGSGALREILAPEGATAPVGAVIARLDLDEASSAAAKPLCSGEPPPLRQSSPASPPAQPPVHRTQSSRVVATPLARRLARGASIELAGLQGSGPRGRIVADDVRRLLPSVEVADKGPAAAGSPGSPAEDAEAGTWIIPSARHQAMARRLTQAKQDIPHFYLQTEFKVRALLALKAELAGHLPELKLTLTPFFVLAIARALHDQPLANRVWADGRILALERVDCGVAVDTEHGLVAPVLQDARAGGLRHVASRLQALIGRARAGQLSADDLQGGACTLSNAGMHDVSYMASIINPGQSSILGVGALRRVFRPDEQGDPELSEEIGVVLSCDHRVLDGVSALQFLNAIRAHIEEPLSLLL